MLNRLELKKLRGFYMKHLYIAIAFMSIVAMFIFLRKDSFKEKKQKVMEISEINGIYYKYNAARGWSYSIEIKKEESNYFLNAKFDDPENSYKPTDLIWESEKYAQTIKMFFDRIIAVFDNNDVLSWDGFDGHDPRALDGWGFDLRIDFGNGSQLIAKGENSFPKGYSEVRKEFYDLINEIIRIYHDSEK